MGGQAFAAQDVPHLSLDWPGQVPHPRQAVNLVDLRPDECLWESVVAHSHEVPCLREHPLGSGVPRRWVKDVVEDKVHGLRGGESSGVPDGCAEDCSGVESADGRVDTASVCRGGGCDANVTTGRDGDSRLTVGAVVSSCDSGASSRCSAATGTRLTVP